MHVTHPFAALVNNVMPGDFSELPNCRNLLWALQNVGKHVFDGLLMVREVTRHKRKLDFDETKLAHSAGCSTSPSNTSFVNFTRAPCNFHGNCACFTSAFSDWFCYSFVAIFE